MRRTALHTKKKKRRRESRCQCVPHLVGAVEAVRVALLDEGEELVGAVEGVVRVLGQAPRQRVSVPGMSKREKGREIGTESSL